MAENSGFLERRIVIGLVVSTDYISQVQPVWDSRYIQSATTRLLASWCLEYYESYQKAPGQGIEGIYYAKLQAGAMSKELAEEIEEDILPGLSEEYEHDDHFNVQYLLDQTRQYFRTRHLQLHSEEIQSLVDMGEIDEAESKAAGYSYSLQIEQTGLDLSQEIALTRVEQTFEKKEARVIAYPRALGELWNDQLSRDSLVALMAPEKRGKTFWLLDMAIRAIRSKANVAFFQAGDMSEGQQLRRICIHLAKKSDMAKYCGKVLMPVGDCVFNQNNTCDREERECDFGVLDTYPLDPWEFRKQLNHDDLLQAWKEEPDYLPCRNCQSRIGSIWYKEEDTGPPLTGKEAKEQLRKFFANRKSRFKLSTHVNGTLSIEGIQAELKFWEREDGFVPDVIVIDYADLLTTKRKLEFRHQQDEIWRGLRGLSQERHCLVLTATQSDAKSYERDRLRLSNFSEDKRKYAHVTAMYGLNQDTRGQEKKMGLMRVNELVVREGEFHDANEVYVMQCLQRGKPFLGSFK